MLDNETASLNTATRANVPFLWLFFYLFAICGHLLAWVKVLSIDSIDGFDVVNDRTKICYYAFGVIDSNPMIWVVLAAIGLLLCFVSIKRNYSTLTRAALFLPLYSFTFLYGAGMSYLGLKFINYGIA